MQGLDNFVKLQLNHLNKSKLTEVKKAKARPSNTASFSYKRPDSTNRPESYLQVRMRPSPQLKVPLKADGRPPLRREALLQRLLVPHHLIIHFGREGDQRRVVLDRKD
jgi:hypothetical protein